MANALSSKTLNLELNTILMNPYWVDFPKLCNDLNNNLTLNYIREALQHDPALMPKYFSREGLLFFKERLVLSPNFTLIPFFLTKFHDTTTGDHSGFTKTYKKLAATFFFWKGMKKHIMDYIQGAILVRKISTKLCLQ